MPQLHQILAAERGRRSRIRTIITALHRDLQLETKTRGLQRVYTPHLDDGIHYPPEGNGVRVQALDHVAEACEAWADLVELMATKSEANMHARGDVVVDGETLAEDVPVPTLLAIENLLRTEVRTLVVGLPVLNAEHDWDWDPNRGCWATRPVESLKTRKKLRPLELAPATIEHPAQVGTVEEEELEGRWMTTHLSGAVPADVKAEMLAWVDKLLAAVIEAREGANTIEAPPVRMPWVLDRLAGLAAGRAGG